MKQKLILFSVLLIISLLTGIAYAVEDTENTDVVSVGEENLSVNFSYSGTGYFKEGDIVEITATFNKPVLFAELTGEAGIIPLLFDETNKIDDTVWSCNYTVESEINDAVNVTVFAFDSMESEDPYFSKTDAHAFIIDNEAPKFKGIQPSSEFVNTKCVTFEFSAFDKLDNTIAYAIFINGTENKTKTGIVNSNEIVKYEAELADGNYTWEVRLTDDAGNVGTSGIIDLYVDTKAPDIIVVSPTDLFVCTDENPLTFNFTCQDNLSAKYKFDLFYQLYINGEPAEGPNCSGYMSPGEYVNVPEILLDDGVYNWSVYVEDKAGNNCTSKVRNFYVCMYGLDVELISPDGGFVPPSPQFNFSISGGAGLPFYCQLIVDGEKVQNANGTFIIGEDEFNEYSVTASVNEGIDKNWTVNITDCAGRTYQPEPLTFSVDYTAPAPVTNLKVIDALGDTTWYYIYDEPGLYVQWDKNTEEDLYDGEGSFIEEEAYYGLPYLVFISDCKPLCIEDMKLALPVSFIYETEDGKSLFMNIGEYDGKPLVYGKDYWVAVIALDRAGNYDESFSMCGPVRTYEDMSISLDAGWNLKSVPKRLLTSNADACSVFGESSTVIYWNGTCWEFPTNIEPCKGYWVYTPEASMSNVKFKPMSTDSTTPDVPASLNLAPGWQMVGHTSTMPVQWYQSMGSLQGLMGVEYKFSNIITYSHNEGWGGTISLGFIDLLSEGEPDETPYPVGVLKSEGFMVPGQGYWIFMKEKGTYASVESVDFYPEGEIPYPAAIE